MTVRNYAGSCQPPAAPTAEQQAPDSLVFDAGSRLTTETTAKMNDLVRCLSAELQAAGRMALRESEAFQRPRQSLNASTGLTALETTSAHEEPGSTP